MNTIFDEFRTKDFLFLILLFIGVAILSNLHLFISSSQKINEEGYQISSTAKILSIEPKTQRLETLTGSKLRKVGYSLTLEYTIDSILYKITTDVLFNHYNVSRLEIEKIISHPEKILPIKVKDENKECVIVNF